MKKKVERTSSKDTVLESWSDVNELLFDFSPHPQHGRFRSTYAFRGLSDHRFNLRTSLARLEGPYWKLEKHLIESFKKYAYESLAHRSSTWHLLSLAQHHGLPTRLLDWTYSPYVALHFATADSDKFNKDGVIWRVDTSEVNRCLSDSLSHILEERKALVFTVEMLDEVVPTLEQLDQFSRPPYLLFFEPPSLDARIVNQFALFSVISNPRVRLDSWLAESPSYYSRIIVPANLKWEIRDKLDAANITERMLFPGLDGLSTWLKRWYSPKK